MQAFPFAHGASTCHHTPSNSKPSKRCGKKSQHAADKAQIVTISHYHYDHHTPSFEDWVVNWTAQTETARQIYQGKEVYAKNPKENINASQRERAWMFQKTGGKYAKTLKTRMAKPSPMGTRRLRFSEAVAHGEDNSDAWLRHCCHNRIWG